MAETLTAEKISNAYRNVINTRTKSKASIRADSELYAGRLAPIIGGLSGKLSPRTAYECADGLTIQEQCTVSNVMPFTGETLVRGSEIPVANLYLREARFVNRITAGTATMVKRIRNYDTDVLSPAFSLPVGRTDTDKVRHAVIFSRNYKSSLYSMVVDYVSARVLMRSDVNYLKMLLLEGMHLYMELYRLKSGTSYTSDITSLDMSLVLQNIEAVMQYFQLAQSEKLVLNRYDIIHELRLLQDNVLGAKTDIIDYL